LHLGVPDELAETGVSNPRTAAVAGDGVADPGGLVVQNGKQLARRVAEGHCPICTAPQHDVGWIATKGRRKPQREVALDDQAVSSVCEITHQSLRLR
jgi:hypothetical protein